jgi:hypothetical protein
MGQGQLCLWFHQTFLCSQTHAFILPCNSSENAGKAPPKAHTFCAENLANFCWRHPLSWSRLSLPPGHYGLRSASLNHLRFSDYVDRNKSKGP